MDLFEGMSNKDRDQFRRVCSRLLSMCFICKKNESTRNDYFFIMRQRPVFEHYFDILGLSMEISEQYGVIQLVSRDGSAHVQLKLIDSLVLLILRILYDEKKRELSLSDVVVNVGDIQEKYLSMKVRNKQIDKTSMNNALRTLKRYNVIDTLDRDLSQEDARILIYDSILMAVRVEDIQKVSELVDQYRKDRKEESDEDTAADQAD
ncbi:MAG: DUF4194 domain-containing protein [Eubacterium sp.]|nr:DUF4194 domain-containing protein [Eubacterium sp.]